MAIPVKYRKGGKVLTNYSYSDIAEGTGYVKFNCMDLASGAYHILVTDTESTSDPLEHRRSSSGTVLDATYTTTNNLPRKIKGTAYVNIPILADSGAASENVYASAALFVNGENIGSVMCAAPMGKINAGYVATFPIVLADRQLRRGDVLGLNISVNWSKVGSTATTYVFHDPRGTIGYDVSSEVGSISAKMGVSIPFKITT